MREPEQENPLPQKSSRNAEAQLGGADAVEKTTYVVGKGTEPSARKGSGPAATVPSGGAPRAVIAVIVMILILVFLGYVFGVIG